MNRRTISRVLGALFALSFTSTAFAQTAGQIKGTVTDAATNAPLPGVTVTITGPALQGEATEFTDDQGKYIITELPPGEYMVRFYFANIVAERPNVVLRAEQTLSLNIAMKTQEAETQTYQITERAPTVDVGSTQVITTVTNELVRNVPVRGRTYESVLTFAPGATTDAVGISFGGSTGPENNYLLDGLNTTDTAYGLVGTPLTLEFLEETNIITAGYRAEYGRATGGVVSLVTKSGSNDVKGSVWFHGQGLLIDSPMVARLGEAIGSERNRNNRVLDFGFEIGGPIVKDWVWFYAGAAPTLVSDRYRRVLRQRLASGSQTINPGARYLGDLDQDASCPEWSTDAGGNADSPLCIGPGVRDPAMKPPSGFLTEELPGSEIFFDSDSRLINYIAKLDFRFSDDHRASVSYVGSPSTFNGVFDNVRNPASLGLGFNSDPTAGVFTENIQVHDVIGRVSSKLLDRKLQVQLTAGFHSSFDEVIPQNQGTSVLDTREQPLTTYEDVAACRPTMVMASDGTMVPFYPCPVSSYRHDGFGFFNDLLNQRMALTLDFTYFAELAGTHAIKIGGDYENNRYRDHRGYTGAGRFDIINAAGGIAERVLFGTIDQGTGEVELLPQGFTADTNTYNESFFVQDSYSTSFLPGLTIDLGLRWEFQQLKDVDGTTAIAINDNIAPRLGVIYDWTQRGLSKVFANYGRFFESIPLDINDRAFAREALVFQDLFPGDPGYCRTDANGKILADTCNYPAPTRDEAYGGEIAYIQPNLKGQYSDQIAAGVEYDVGLETVLGLAYIHRSLGRVIEDVSPDGGNTYVVANPGAPVDQGVVNDIQNQVTAAREKVEAASTDEQRALAEYELGRAIALLNNYRDIATFPEATRYYNALQFTARKRLTNNFQVLASYTYSRVTGNYPGLFQDSNGQLDPNISTQYDIKDLLSNRDGPMPNDRPHNIKLIGSYFFPLGASEEDGITLGLTFTAISGRPIEVLGRHPLYGRLETFILPRGAGGRTPWITALDLGIHYTKDLGSGYKLQLAWDTFNVLNQKGVTSVDEEYTVDRVNAIPNGDIEDLANLKTYTGTFARRAPNYGQPTAYQAPLSMRFGARVSF